MNSYPSAQEAQLDALQRLILALKVMPGIGPKSAQRMAYYLLQHDRQGALSLGVALQEAVEKIGHCSQCNSFSELVVCKTCHDDRRDGSVLCVVETRSIDGRTNPRLQRALFCPHGTFIPHGRSGTKRITF